MRAKKMGILLLVALLVLPLTARADWGDANSNEELRRLQVERERLVRQDDDIRREMQRLDREVQGARRNEDVAQRELDAASRDLQLAQREVANLSQQVARLEQEIARERQRKEQDIRSNQNTVAQARLGISQAQTNIQMLERQLQNLAGQRNPARLQQIQSENAQDEKLKAEKEDRLKFVKERHAWMVENCRITECIPQILDLERQQRELEAELPQINQRIADRNQEAQKLQEVENQYVRADKDLGAARSNLASQERELAAAEQRLAEAQNRPIQGERELPIKQAELRTAQSKVSALEQRQQRASLDRERFRNESRRLMDSVDRLARDSDSVRRNLESVERRIAELERVEPLERVVVVGRDITSSLKRELQESNVTLVDVESFSTDRNAVLRSLDTILYVMSETLSQGLPDDAEAAVLEVIQRGGMVVVVGNPNALALDTRSELKRLLGVEGKFTISSSRLSGRGLLSGLEASVSVRAIELGLAPGGASVEKVLVSGSNEVVGTSSLVSRARLMTLALDNETLQLRVLGDVERSLCKNLRSSSELSARRFCL